MNNIIGLSEIEAEKILKRDGYNELPSQKKRNIFSLFLSIFSEPMILLLSACGIIYLFLGETKDALFLLFSIFVIIGITLYQEQKTEKTLEALKDLSSPRALVIRDGKEKRIPGRELVKGDIVIAHEGDRIPADSVIISCNNLFIDESLLTGESIPVRKSEWDGKMDKKRPGGDDLPFAYSGSLITGGRGILMVKSTGLETEIGKIGKSLEKIKDEDTLLHKETGKIVRFMAIIGLTLCLLVLVFYVIAKNDLLGGILAGLTLGMAMVPEEFPVVLIIFLTLGAWRISKKKVLTRKSAAIETLGAATVLCTDKTGTLTLNKMELSSLYCDGSFYELSNFATTELSPKFKNLLEYGVLASQKDAYDPMEKELHKMFNLYLKNSPRKIEDYNLIKEYPFSKEIMALSHVWQSTDKKKFLIASKGSPETILNLCHADKEQKKEILEKVKEMSEKGLRALGVAESTTNDSNLPDNQHDFIFRFIGLLGFVDPIRTSAPGAVKEAYEAGIRVIMITGDYSGTAQFVAKKIGIKNPEKFLTGEDLENISHIELREKIKNVNIFARILPEQKLNIVNALKANNEIVAMTGDGVNDAPALKSAHIGIAMGERGTDVARETSSLILLNDDFSSIVDAIRLGRRIYDNLRQAMSYLIAVHVPIAGMTLLPLFFGFPIILLPAHIAFLELIIDPACSTVFEAEKEDKNIMKKPPRNLKQPMFNWKNVLISISQGLSILIVTFLLLLFMIKSGKNELEVRSFVFSALVIANIILILVNLSWKKSIYKTISSGNKLFIIISINAILCLLAVIYIPFFTEIFHLTPLHPEDWLIVLFSAIISLFWFEAFKLIKKIY